MNIFITGINGSLGQAISAMAIAEGHSTTGTPRGIADKKTMEAACDSAAFTFTYVNQREPVALKVDLLVLNDGINHLSFIGDTPQEDVAIMHVNVMAQYWALNWFVSQGIVPPRIIFVGSQTHKVAQRTTSLYCASKAALVQMARVAARELAPKGVQVNVLCPGKIEDTTMSQLTDAQVTKLRGWTHKEADAYAKSLIPMGRFTSAREVANAVLWLARAPAYVNGAVIDMNGGA